MQDDKNIINAIRMGDLTAFSLLVKQNEQLVAFMVRKLISNTEDVEDICQDVFIKVYRSLNNFKFQSKLSTWIARIAYNTALTYLNQQYTQKKKTDSMKDMEMSFEASSEFALEKKDSASYVHEFINQLPLQYKSVVILYYINEFSYQEIVEITGLPLGTVKGYLFRAKKLLKQRLEIFLKTEDK